MNNYSKMDLGRAEGDVLSPLHSTRNTPARQPVARSTNYGNGEIDWKDDVRTRPQNPLGLSNGVSSIAGLVILV